MKLSSNRILLSQTDLFTTINNNSTNKIDLSFIEKRYHLDKNSFKTELDLIRSRNKYFQHWIMDKSYYAIMET